MATTSGGAGASTPTKRPTTKARDVTFAVDEYSLVTIRHPTTGKFVAVKETRGRGIWLVGGHVAAGETFVAAALREAREEAGIDIVLRGVLRVEHSVTGDASARMRVQFYAEPADPAAPLKSEPDAESEGAMWLSVEELAALKRIGKLRNSAVYDCAAYVAAGGAVYPLSVLSDEWDPLPPAAGAAAASGGAAAS